MNKKFLLIGVGIVLILTGVLVFFLTPGKKEVQADRLLSEKEGMDIVNSKVKEVVNLYENSIVTYDAKEEVIDEVIYLKIKDYDKIMGSIFNKDGRKQLEATKIKENAFYLKKGNDNYILKDMPKEYSLLQSKVSIDNVDIKLKSLTAKVTFSYSLLDKEDNLTYYVITRVVEIVKEKDDWLIKAFNYVDF